MIIPYAKYPWIKLGLLGWQQAPLTQHIGFILQQCHFKEPYHVQVTSKIYVYFLKEVSMAMINNAQKFVRTA